MFPEIRYVTSSIRLLTVEMFVKRHGRANSSVDVGFGRCHTTNSSIGFYFSLVIGFEVPFDSFERAVLRVF